MRSSNSKENPIRILAAIAALFLPLISVAQSIGADARVVSADQLYQVDCRVYEEATDQPFSGVLKVNHSNGGKKLSREYLRGHRVGIEQVWDMAGNVWNNTYASPDYSYFNCMDQAQSWDRYEGEHTESYSCDIQHRGVCYSVERDTPRTFMQAEQLCVDKYNGHLASIQNATEGYLIGRALDPFYEGGISAWVGGFADGGFNEGPKAKYQWTDGSDWTHSQWDKLTDEPDVAANKAPAAIQFWPRTVVTSAMTEQYRQKKLTMPYIREPWWNALPQSNSLDNLVCEHPAQREDKVAQKEAPPSVVVVDASQVGFKDGKLYQAESDTPFSGAVRWKNNGLRSRNGYRQDWPTSQEFVGGLRSGTVTHFYPDSTQKIYQANYENDVRNGRETFWHENGQMAAEQMWVDGKPDGSLTAESGDQALSSDQLSYTNGVVFEKGSDTPYSGQVISNHPSGELRRTVHFVNGTEHGISMTYDSNGRLESREVFINGQRDGDSFKLRFDFEDDLESGTRSVFKNGRTIAEPETCMLFGRGGNDDCDSPKWDKIRAELEAYAN